MKITKNILAVVLAIAAILSLATAAKAQDPRAYTVGPWNGGTNVLAAASQSITTVTLATSEYNSAKLQFSLKCTAATSGNVIVRTYRTLDSSNYETTATTNLVALNGTTAVSGVIDLSETYLANCAGLKVQFDNTNATAIFTNINVGVRFNAPSVRIRSN